MNRLPSVKNLAVYTSIAVTTRLRRI